MKGKGFIFFSTLIAVALLVFTSCNRSQEEREIIALVTEFYNDINKLQFDSIENRSNPTFAKYVDYLGKTLGENVVEIESIDVLRVDIEKDTTMVYVMAMDYYDINIYYEWQLTKEDNIWKYNDLTCYDSRAFLTIEDYIYAKE